MNRETYIELLHLIQDMRAVIADFMPNVGNCALQDYQRLNEALTHSRDVLNNAGMEVPESGKFKRVA